MRINIIYKDDKVTIDSAKRHIDLIDLFDRLRVLYGIENDKKLMLLSESLIYKEHEYINSKHIHESNLSKLNAKEDFVLMSLDDYENIPYKHEIDPGDARYSKENLIMCVTGAANPIKIEKKIKAKARQLRNTFFNNIDMTNLIGYQRYGVQSDLGEDERSEESSLENADRGMMNRLSAMPTLLGRIRERDSNQLAEYSLYTTSSSVREEDINRLVNEMGFADNSVRIALRMTRNNINRAVDLLLNNPEELTEENIDLSHRQQSLSQRNQAATQTNAAVIRENQTIPNRAPYGFSRNFDERTESTFDLQIPVTSASNMRSINELLEQGINPSNIQIFNNNESLTNVNADNVAMENNDNNNVIGGPEIVFSPFNEYYEEDEEEEDSSLDDNFILNQEEDEEMEYDNSIQSDDNSDEFV